jgi:NADH-ubiquinone oxidoreductase chain 4
VFLGGFLVFVDFSCFLVFLGAFLVLLFFSSLSFFYRGMVFFDSVSFTLVFLRVFVYFLSVYGRMQEFNSSNMFGGFVFCLTLIFFLLIVRFTSLNLFVFYVSFEFIFLVMFIFLVGWGYSPERRQASFYMVFYTLVVSFPFLVFLLWRGYFLGSVMIFSFFEWVGYWWFFLIFVFMVKLPVFGVHLWLPKAHVEAPVSGSMILAGVLLKLGGYGFFRLCGTSSRSLFYSSGYIFSLGLVGGLIRCFFCLRQVDMKSFVAYSSVCHMGMALAGVFSFSFFGWWGGWFIFFSHGLCSSCLFYLLYVFYERFFSRSMFVLKGSLFHVPLLAFWWFMFCVLNMGVPPSLSFFSEVYIVIRVGGYAFFSFLLLALLLFFSGVYSIYLFVGVMHGGSFFSNVSFLPMVREYMVFFCHLFPSVIIVFFLGSFFWWLVSLFRISNCGFGGLRVIFFICFLVFTFFLRWFLWVCFFLFSLGEGLLLICISFLFVDLILFSLLFLIIFL